MKKFQSKTPVSHLATPKGVAVWDIDQIPESPTTTGRLACFLLSTIKMGARHRVSQSPTLLPGGWGFWGKWEARFYHRWSGRNEQ